MRVLARPRLFSPPSYKSGTRNSYWRTAFRGHFFAVRNAFLLTKTWRLSWIIDPDYCTFGRGWNGMVEREWRAHLAWRV